MDIKKMATAELQRRLDEAEDPDLLYGASREDQTRYRYMRGAIKRELMDRRTRNAETSAR